jgi:hypothetical protein
MNWTTDESAGLAARDRPHPSVISRVKNESPVRRKEVGEGERATVKGLRIEPYTLRIASVEEGLLRLRR